jgi:hypothetical protein
MNRGHTLTQTHERAESRGTTGTLLHGRWLFLGRIAWVVVIVLSLAVSIADIPLEFARLHIVCVGPSCTGQQLTVGIVQELHKMNLSVDFYAACFVILDFGFYFVWFVVAVVIFWRKSNDWMALLVALFLVLFPATQGLGGPLGSPAEVAAAYPSLHLLASFLDSLGWFSFILFLYLFPNGRFVPRWTAVLISAMLIGQVLAALFPNSYFNVDWVFPGLDIVLYAIVVGVGIFSQIYRYIRVSNRVQRQQTKWIVLGVTAAVGIFIGLVVISLRFPSSNNYNFLGEVIGNIFFSGAALLIPLSIGFSVLRYRLYDIDFLINRTLVYGILTALLATIYFSLVFGLQYLLQGLIRQANDIVIVVSTLAIAALFQPLRRRIQKLIDRRFYRQKYDAVRTLAAFNATLRSEVELSQLSEHLVAVVQETMHPAHVSLWIRRTEQERNPK